MPDVRITDVPPELLECANRVAKQEGVSIADVFLAAIVATYDLRITWERRRYGGGASSSPDVTIDVPEEVRAFLRREGPGKGLTIRGLCVAALAKHCGVNGHTDARRRPRT